MGKSTRDAEECLQGEKPVCLVYSVYLVCPVN